MEYRLLIDTIDRKGLICLISDLLYRHDLNIDENSEYVDRKRDKFFMRTVFSGKVNLEELERQLRESLPEGANVKVRDNSKKNIILMVTKENHCLGDILVRNEGGTLDANILAVVSNYDKLRPFTEKFDVPYYHISHEGKTREEHEAEIMKILEKYKTDYIVLAKYMRILSPEFVAQLKGKIINIHHSFLPAFIGANPYKQAFERGVKIIGATSHFVTDDLDEGPIISQDVIPVNHKYSWHAMQKVGWNVEKNVLSKALNLILEDRVFVYENKTIIL